MHPLLKTLLGMIVVGGIGAVAVWYYQTSSTEQAYTTEIRDLQQQWTERLGRIRGVEDPQRYKEEMGAALKWYFSELQSVHNKFPDHRDTDRAWKEIEEDNRAGRIPSDRMDEYQEFFTYAKDAYQLLERGEYTPDLNAESENLHLDVYSIKRADYEGVPRLKIDFMLWGAPRRIQEKKTAAGTLRKVVVPIRFTRMFLQFIDEKGKVYGEMTGNSGEPEIRVDHPERWIAEFPAQAVLGTWWLPPFPPEAHKLIWEVDVSGTTDAGNAYNAGFRWEFEVPEPWKTAGDWGGTEQVMPEEYINRTAAN